MSKVPSSVGKDWVSYVKYVRGREACSYKEAMAVASKEWGSYMKDFDKNYPNYNHEAVLEEKRKLRAEKQKEKTSPSIDYSKGRGKKGKKRQSMEKKEELEEGEMKGYDEVEKTKTKTVYRKRKHVEPSTIEQSMKDGETNQPKKRRKRYRPKKLNDSGKEETILEQNISHEKKEELKREGNKEEELKREENKEEEKIFELSQSIFNNDDGDANKENHPPSPPIQSAASTLYVGGYNLF